MGETKCVTCNFDIGVGASNGSHSKEMTYLDFVIKKGHTFIRDVFDPEELSKSVEIKTFESYFENFKLFLQILTLLDSSYSSESDIDDVSDECVVNFVDENDTESFNELHLEMANTQVKNVSSLKKTKTGQFKLISYVYTRAMKFITEKFEIKTLMTKKVFNDVINQLYGDFVIHYSHVTGENSWLRSRFL